MALNSCVHRYICKNLCFGIYNFLKQIAYGIYKKTLEFLFMTYKNYSFFFYVMRDLRYRIPLVCVQ